MCACTQWGEEDLRQFYELHSNDVIDLQIRRQNYCFFLNYPLHNLRHFLHILQKMYFSVHFFTDTWAGNDREAVKAHRECPADIRRSKCAARVRSANIEIIVWAMRNKNSLKPRKPRDEKSYKLHNIFAYVKKKLYLCSGFHFPNCKKMWFWKVSPVLAYQKWLPRYPNHRSGWVAAW